MSTEDTESFCRQIEESGPIVVLKALQSYLLNTKASTAAEVSKELSEVAQDMMKKAHGIPFIRSTTEVFIKSVSLASADELYSEMDHFFQLYKDRAARFIERVGESGTVISSGISKFLSEADSIITNGFDSVVFDAIVYSYVRHADFLVHVAEARPTLSGYRMVRKLKDHDVRVNSILDCEIGAVMNSADAVIIGTDGVTESGDILGKLGTLPMILCAKAMKKPVYVLAQSIKFLKDIPLGYDILPDDFKVISTKYKRLFSDTSKGYPIYDYTPSSYIDLFFTDLGILSTAAVGDELMKIHI